MGNDAFEWKFGMNKYVFLKQKYWDFVTKFIVCLSILSQCPFYTDSFQGFDWFRLRNSELLKSSSLFWFPKRFSEILFGFAPMLFYFRGFSDSDHRFLEWQNLLNHSWFFKWFSEMLLYFLRFSVIWVYFIFRRS